MNEYAIRQAIEKDIPFLADVVIAAEKSNSDKLSYSTLFNLPEERVKDLIIAMFEEGIDGCEFSVSSFMVTEYKDEPVAGFGGWIEGLEEDGMPSKILKSNLIGHTFGKEAVGFLKTRSHIIKDILAEREPLTLQLEYLFVSADHRGKRLANGLIQRLEEKNMIKYPALEKVQVQVFKNNVIALNLYQKNGFEFLRSYKSNNNEILDYLPFNEKYVMEKNMKKY